MIIWYFGGYKNSRKFPRNQILINILKKKHTVTKIQSEGLFVSRWKSLYQKAKFTSKPNAIIVGVPGFYDVPLAKYFAIKFSCPLIFDAFIPLYEMYVEDRKMYSPSSLKAKWLAYVDQKCCRIADYVLIDTQTHADYYAQFTRLARFKFISVPVGTDERLFDSSKYQAEIKSAKKSDEFVAYYHGNFIALHGLEVIVDAAKILRQRSDITFILLGSGSEKEKISELISQKGLKNIRLEDPVEYTSLPEKMARADVFLGGPFGVTTKSKRVIPNKVYESIAMKIPVIVGDTSAMREFLSESEATLVETGNPVKLAEAILWAESHKNQIGTKAERAYKKFQEYAGEGALVEKMEGILRELEYRT